MGKLGSIFKRNKKADGVVIEPPQTVEVEEVEFIPPPPRISTGRVMGMSTISDVRRNGAPVPTIVVSEAIKGMGQTLIIQYPRRSMGGRIKDTVRKYKRKSAESFIDKFIEIDIFVNINRDPSQMRGNNWLSVVYECLEDNIDPTAASRYPDATIIRVREVTDWYQLDSSTITLDMLLEGRR